APLPATDSCAISTPGEAPRHWRGRQPRRNRMSGGALLGGGYGEVRRNDHMNTVVTRRAQKAIEPDRSGLRLIADNGEAFAARVLAARGATTSLDLMYYLWHDDH